MTVWFEFIGSEGAELSSDGNAESDGAVAELSSAAVTTSLFDVLPAVPFTSSSWPSRRDLQAGAS